MRFSTTFQILAASILAASILAASILAGLLGLLGPGSLLAAEPAQDPAASKLKVAKTADLGGPSRYTTHLSTDKPIYRPNETVYIRGVLLHAITHQPLGAKAPQRPARLEILGPKGEVVSSSWAQLQDSTAGSAWKIPEGQAGGEYRVKISHPVGGFPPAERTFEVRNYRAPRLKSQIVFVRDGYGPGDRVSATLHVERAEGGIPAGASVEAIARLDGREVYRGPAQVDRQGNCGVTFQLPQQIARGEGTLALIVQDGGVVETASKTIPILLQTVDLQMFPEGGELVAGLPTRLYLEARTPYGKPADLAGVIVDELDREVGSFRTVHEGRGRVALTPIQGRNYRLKITEPTGIKTLFDVPQVKVAGTVIGSRQDAYVAGEPVMLTLGSTQEQELVVTLRKREQEVARCQVHLQGGSRKQVKLEIPASQQESATGVLVATVYNRASGQPLAERLVFVRPKQELNIEILCPQRDSIPGDEVELQIKTTLGGKPVSAVVGLTVTDDSVLEMIEKREQAPRLPVMVLLEHEVRELADAEVYLDRQNTDAPRALDLLLGTQGWRRFALVDAAKFIAKHGDDGRRVLALKMATLRERENRLQLFNGNGEAFHLGAPLPEAPVEEAAPVPNAPIPEAAVGDDAAARGKPALQDPRAGQQGDRADERVAEQPNAGPPLPAAKPRPALEPPVVADVPESSQRAQLRRALEKDAKKEAVLLAGEVSGDRLSHQQIVVREYAHQVRPGRKLGDRVDFTETLYWSAGTRTDRQTGTATVKFALSDAVTSFRIFADGFHGSGVLGASEGVIESVEPFYIEPKLPLEVTAGDQVLLPLGLVNATSENFNSGQITFAGEDLPPGVFQLADVPAGERIRQIVDLLIPAGVSGSRDIVVAATAGKFSDRVTRPLAIQPRGFPAEQGKGGMLLPDSTQTWTLKIPKSVVRGSVTAQAKVFPTPLGSLTAGLQRLIREPYGCFEQTTSTTYPLVMAQQYFTTHTGVDPALIERSNKLLEKGYQRLTGFECDGGGYEWFGEDPGHLTLTAFGLMEFTDMAEVYQVDSKMLARTRQWLLKQRDGQGSWKNARRALHQWVTNEDVVNSYVTWCLLECGEKGLEKEIAWVKKASLRNENSYVLALAANVLWLAGDKQGARAAMDDLGARQTQQGFLDGAEQSIVGSRGVSLNIETTALATLAWLRDPDYADFAQKGITYLTEQCKGGRFGSTQSTVLALKAIVAYDKAMAKPKHPGQLRLIVDGQDVGQPLAFLATSEGELVLPDFAERLSPGEHTVQIAMNDGSSMPFAITVNFYDETPESSKQASIELEVKLTKTELIEGGITEAAVQVTNTEDQVATNPMAIIGVPGGLEVRQDQLKELVKAGRIASYEVLGREVVLYWRELEGGKTIELPISLVAEIPGRYTGPASRSYLYYGDEHKHWVPGLSCTVAPR